MARYKETNKKQGQFIPVIFEEQILPGTIEYAICDIIDNHVDTSVFNARYEASFLEFVKRKRTEISAIKAMAVITLMPFMLVKISIYLHF